ncbi:ubiquitin-conjugating enzyme family protein [Gimesia panareensis]|uniref:hypothetical protein n=1 Tax=Gimesia panareensis TaxID=2527978 RepID=UPI00118A6365|nr:hypothetical protein [Gimesia panareensis]QDU52113.1 hypothetical protein Pan110_44850 [Gimesia panareensis]
MPHLTKTQLASRLRYDFQVVKSIEGPMIQVSAYCSVSDLKRKHNAITEVEAAGEATHYLIEYHIKSLKTKGKFHSKWLCHVDLLAEGSYPFSKPVAHIVSKPIPWSPHFLRKVGLICLGDNFWQNKNGDTLLYHLVIHVAKLLNFDEPYREWYSGWNREAVQYWGSVLKGQPITPGLIYPIASHQLTHGKGEKDSCQSTDSHSDLAAMFKPIRQVSKPNVNLNVASISTDIVNQYFKKVQ